MTRYHFHPEARADLDEIWEYIRAANLDGADRLIADILSASSKPDLTARRLRFIRVRDYLIAYAPDEKPLSVVAVIHGSRDPRVMAAILRARE